LNPISLAKHVTQDTDLLGPMSAFGGKADIAFADQNVRF